MLYIYITFSFCFFLVIFFLILFLQYCISFAQHRNEELDQLIDINAGI